MKENILENTIAYITNHEIDLAKEKTDNTEQNDVCIDVANIFLNGEKL